MISECDFSELWLITSFLFFLDENCFICSMMHIWCVLLVFLTFLKQEFSDPRDADDARHYLDGKDFDGSRIIVEFAKGVSSF